MCKSDLDAFCKVSVCVCVHGGSLFRMRSEYPIIILSPVNNGPVYPWSAPLRHLSTLLTLCRSRLNLHRKMARWCGNLKICFLRHLKILRLITFDHCCSRSDVVRLTAGQRQHFSASQGQLGSWNGHTYINHSAGSFSNVRKFCWTVSTRMWCDHYYEPRHPPLWSAHKMCSPTPHARLGGGRQGEAGWW